MADVRRHSNMQFSIRSVMVLVTISAAIIFLWMKATPIALFVLSLLPTGWTLIACRKEKCRRVVSIYGVRILFAIVFAYVGSIGPFNMLLGTYLCDHSRLTRLNILGCWVYYPLRVLPISTRDLLDMNYISGWRNYGVHIANLNNDELRVPSFPTQLYR